MRVNSFLYPKWNSIPASLNVGLWCVMIILFISRWCFTLGRNWVPWTSGPGGGVGRATPWPHPIICLENVSPGWPDLQNIKRNQKHGFFYMEFPEFYVLTTHIFFWKHHQGQTKYIIEGWVGLWAISLQMKFSFGPHPEPSSGPARQIKYMEEGRNKYVQWGCLLACLQKGLVRQVVERESETVSWLSVDLK